MGKKKNRPSSQEEEKRGAIYVGHVPRSFVETGIQKFFAQFGTVTKVKLARSKKTGNPKGYAFVEFHNVEVAEIAADTMNGYLMCGRVLKCNVVPEIKRSMFIGHRSPYHRQPRRKTAIGEYNKPRTHGEREKQIKRLLVRTRRKREKLEKLGIQYSFPDIDIQKAKHMTFNE